MGKVVQVSAAVMPSNRASSSVRILAALAPDERRLDERSAVRGAWSPVSTAGRHETTMSCMVDGEASNLVAQMRRGVLPFCVLAMLGDGERYGFELVRALASVDGMVTGEGTIYPLLARLRRQGLVETTWRESDAGPPRRYYRLAPSGRAAPPRVPRGLGVVLGPRDRPPPARREGGPPQND